MWPWDSIKRRHADGTAAMSREATADLQRQLDRRTRELAEALEQQTATSEVLKVISSSPGELESVFQAMLENAVRICEGKFGALFLCEDDAFRVVARNLPPELAELRGRDPLVRPEPSSSLMRSAKTRQVVQIADMSADPGYAQLDPLRVALVEIGGVRSVLSVPMLKENALVGIFNIYREKRGHFSDKHVELVKSFASQAVIAIENTRLLNELRASLDRQTTTSEVLQVISISPGELAPVFQAMLANATRICGAEYGNMFLREGATFRAVAVHGPATSYVDWYRREPVLAPAELPHTPLARVVGSKAVL